MRYTGNHDAGPLSRVESRDAVDEHVIEVLSLASGRNDQQSCFLVFRLSGDIVNHNVANVNAVQNAPRSSNKNSVRLAPGKIQVLDCPVLLIEKLQRSFLARLGTDLRQRSG